MLLLPQMMMMMMMVVVMMMAMVMMMPTMMMTMAILTTTVIILTISMKYYSSNARVCSMWLGAGHLYNVACSHTVAEVADQTFNVAMSQQAGAGLTIPAIDTMTHGVGRTDIGAAILWVNGLTQQDGHWRDHSVGQWCDSAGL